MFYNGSTYDYHFIIKELVKEFKGNFKCLGENTEKYISFSVPIKKKIENKDMEITSKIKFLDSFRIMATSLSKLVDNLTKGIHTNKCLDCNSCLDYVRITKNEKLLLKCFNCDIYYKKKFNKDLIKKFKNNIVFVIVISISLYYCLEKAFILMNIWIVGKNLTKLHCQSKKIFIAT